MSFHQRRIVIRSRRVAFGAAMGTTLGLCLTPVAVEAKDVGFVQTMELGKSHWSLQGRSRVGMGKRLEFTTSLAGWILASPNLGIRASLLRRTRSRHLHGELSLGLPTLTMVLTRGYLFPSQGGGTKKYPWIIVPRYSLTWAIDTGFFQWTMRSAIAYGIVLSGTAPRALETYAPIEYALAPVIRSRSFRGDLETGVGIPILAWMDALMTLRASLTGVGSLQSSPWMFRFQCGGQFHLGDHWAIQALASWYNYDQGRIGKKSIGEGFVRSYRVRSNEVWPTIGIIWRPKRKSRRLGSGI